MTALNTYEPLINSKVDEFIEQLSKRETIDATAWSMYLSFDIMGQQKFYQRCDALVVIRGFTPEAFLSSGADS